MARRTKQFKYKIIQALQQYGIIGVACNKAGVSPSTYHRWRKMDPEFARLSDEAREQGWASLHDLAESKLISRIQEGYFPAIAFMLGRSNPKFMVQQKNKDDESSIGLLDLLNKARLLEQENRNRGEDV